MYMKDYIQHLDRILSSAGEAVLESSGTVSHAKAIEKATLEYRKYHEQTIAPVEQAYLDSIKALEKEAKQKLKE